MAVYSVEGKLGTGKTKFCVWRAKLALLEGRRVASNVDLYLDKLLPNATIAKYIRIPDKPSSFDLEAIGHGNPESYDEDQNGVLILDELGTWLNSRNFQDKGRAPLIDWLIHARKLGWDVYLIVQDAGMIDKQVRDALIEYKCKCIRLDKVKVPLIGSILSGIGSLIGTKRFGYLPRMHLVVARVGEGQNAVIAERWMYRGDDLHKGYDTRQVFRTDYPDGCHSVIYRAPPPRQSRFQRFLARVFPKPPLRPRPMPRPKHPLVAQVQKLPPDRRIAFMRSHADFFQIGGAVRDGHARQRVAVAHHP